MKSIPFDVNAGRSGRSSRKGLLHQFEASDLIRFDEEPEGSGCWSRQPDTAQMD
jgi:hypothetical protein